MIEWFSNNWSYVLSGLFGLIVFASIIVKVTPNNKDDQILNSILDVLDKFSVVKTERDKTLINIAKGVIDKEKNND